MVLDFTLEKYRELCEAFSGYRVLTVADYLTSQPSERFIILRHDVDRMPGNALRMARLESGLGIASTYYFRHTNEAFNADMIKAVFDMGHEVGYHYETLSKAGGNHEEAVRIFGSELDEFRGLCDVKTVCMHGRPLSRHINSEIWNQCSFSRFGLLGDGGLSVSGVPYFTDAGRAWDNSNNVRDYVKSPDGVERIVSGTDDLVRILVDQAFSGLYVNVHPERWVQGFPEWCFSYSMDLCFNVGKRVFNSLMDATRGHDNGF